MKGKKGIFYSLGLGLFALIILATALLIGKQGGSAESYFIDLVVAKQAGEIQASINKAFSEVYFREGNRTILLRNTSLTILENIPHDYNNLEQIFTSLETNIESNFEEIEINQNEFQNTKGLFLQPLNISYGYENQESIYVDQNLQIRRYTLNLIFEGNITSCTINLIPGGGFNLSFSGVSPSTNCSNQGTNLQSGNMSLIVNGQNVYAILQSDGFFSIVSNVSVMSNVTLEYKPVENVYLQLPIEIIFLEPLQNLSQKSKIKLSLTSLD